MAMNAGEFIGLLFLARDMAHKEHLKAKGKGSFAKHMALGSFYEEIVELADKFAEQHQGRFVELLDIKTPDEKGDYDDICDALRYHMEYIDACREDIVARKYTSLHNVIDEIVGLYESTIYKLEFLE